MRTTINTREFGELEFFTGNGTDYVFVDINGKPGTLGNQICDSGGLMGSRNPFLNQVGSVPNPRDEQLFRGNRVAIPS